MSRPIQVIPQGLLGLLQLKQTGQNPSDLVDSVQAILDLFPFYIQRQSQDLLAFRGGTATRAIATAAPGIYGFTAGFIPTVPQGVTWWVDNYTISAPLLAAETIVVAPAFFTQGLPTPNWILTPPQFDTITARARVTAVTARNFWMQPGTSLGVLVYDVLTAATITVSGNVKGVEIPI